MQRRDEFQRPSDREMVRAQELCAGGKSREEVYGRGRPFYVLRMGQLRLIGYWLEHLRFLIGHIEKVDNARRAVRSFFIRRIPVTAKNVAQADCFCSVVLESFRTRHIRD